MAHSRRKRRKTGAIQLQDNSPASVKMYRMARVFIMRFFKQQTQ